MIDSNTVIRAYLAANAGIVALVGSRIYVPRLPEKHSLPAISLKTRGGSSHKYIPELLNPSKQIDCWADDPMEARQIYRAVYDSLQGIQNVKVTIGAIDYYILSAEEESQGQDLQDEDVQGYFRVLSYFKILVR